MPYITQSSAKRQQAKSDQLRELTLNLLRHGTGPFENQLWQVLLHYRQMIDRLARGESGTAKDLELALVHWSVSVYCAGHHIKHLIELEAQGLPVPTRDRVITRTLTTVIDELEREALELSAQFPIPELDSHLGRKIWFYFKGVSLEESETIAAESLAILNGLTGALDEGVPHAL